MGYTQDDFVELFCFFTPNIGLYYILLTIDQSYIPRYVELYKGLLHGCTLMWQPLEGQGDGGFEALITVFKKIFQSLTWICEPHQRWFYLCLYLTVGHQIKLF